MNVKEATSDGPIQNIQTILQQTEGIERAMIDVDDGEIKIAEVPDKYVLLLTVDANAIDTPNAVIIGGEHTRVGAQFRLKNKKTAFFGTVLGIELVD